MSTTVSYKLPPPPRSSPFRRPESPASPSPLRFSTPVFTAPSIKSPNATSPLASRMASETITASNLSSTPNREKFPSLQLKSHIESANGSAHAADEANNAPAKNASKPAGQWIALSQLQPAQLQSLREAFQILDRDSDGTVDRDDVADMLSQLGLPSTIQDLSAFFPSSSANKQTLPLFLSSIAAVLSTATPSAELLSAFSTFDSDDNGQVDVAELRDILLCTAPEPGERPLSEAEIERVLAGFSGRRVFGTGRGHGGGGGGGLISRRGDVFCYQDFVGSFMGTGGSAELTSSAET